MKKLWQNKQNRQIAIVGICILVLLTGLLISVFTRQSTATPDNGEELYTDIETPDISGQLTQDRPDETTNLENVIIDLVDYEVHDLADPDFRFIIARFRVRGQDTLRISLDDFVTSENISLNDVDDFLNALEQRNLFVGRRNVIFEIISTEENMIATLFIPVRNNNINSLELNTPLNNNKSFSFNLTENINRDNTAFIYQVTDVITDGRTFNMTVSHVFPITGEILFSAVGVEEPYPSTAQLHAFRVQITSLWGDEILIEEVRYVVDGTTIEFIALPGNYFTEARNNILSVPVRENDTGYLIFMSLNPEREVLTYSGTIYIRIAGNPNWIQIQISL